MFKYIIYTIALLVLNACCSSFWKKSNECVGGDCQKTPSIALTPSEAPKLSENKAAVTKEALFTGLTLYFQTAKSDVTSESDKDLDRIAQFAKENIATKFIVEGHVDAAGKPSTNIPLAKRRAEKVKGLLVKRGVAQSRIEAIGFGDKPGTERKAIVKLAK